MNFIFKTETSQIENAQNVFDYLETPLWEYIMETKSILSVVSLVQ